MQLLRLCFLISCDFLASSCLSQREINGVDLLFCGEPAQSHLGLVGGYYCYINIRA